MRHECMKGVAGVIGVMLAAGGTAFAQVGVNIVTNPDAEAGLAGWTDNTGVGTADASIAGPAGLNDPADIGALVFNGGLATGNVETMRQTIDISGLAAFVDAGLVTAHVEAWLQSRRPAASTADLAELHCGFETGAGVLLGATLLVDTSTPVTVYDWNRDFDVLSLPAGTRRVTLTQRFIKDSGASIDAYIDNISVVLSVPCEGDVNADGITDFADLNLLLEGWGATGVPRSDGDLTGDGAVTFEDLNALLEDWGCGG